MNDFNENSKQIKEKANELYDTAKQQASDAYSRTKPKADELADQVKTTASDLYQSGKVGVSQAEDCISETLDRMALSISQQPLKSVLIAAGIGYLWAKLTK